MSQHEQRKRCAKTMEEAYQPSEHVEVKQVGRWKSEATGLTKHAKM